MRHIKIDANGCWNWIGAKDSAGYGTVMGKKFGKRRTLPAHRVSYSVFNGKIPDGLYICHKCDNPPCINPDHLWAGTNLENRQDSVKKNRQAKGNRLPVSKLDYQKVKEIRNAYKTHTISQARLAAIYGVTQSVIWRVLLNDTWRDESYVYKPRGTRGPIRFKPN